MSWNIGLPEEDHAFRSVRQRVSVGVMLQICGPGHIRKLKQRLIALSVMFLQGIVEVILILKFTDMFVSFGQNIKYLLSSIPTQQLLIAEV